MRQSTGSIRPIGEPDRERFEVRVQYTDRFGRRCEKRKRVLGIERAEALRNMLLVEIEQELLEPDGFIYAAQEQSADGFIKIGFSRWPERRVGQHRNNTVRPLKMLGYWSAAGGVIAEDAVLDTFRFCRVEGKREWFHPHPRLLRFIRKRLEQPDAFGRDQHIDVGRVVDAMRDQALGGSKWLLQAKQTNLFRKEAR